MGRFTNDGTRIEKNPKQKHFSVHDDMLFFAPGAIYTILPLFVDEPESGECEGVFEDLEKYSAEAREGAVLGKVAYKSLEKNEVEVTLDAFLVKGGGKDEL